jgi:cytochrome c oxidase cbb3-type subunit IV
MITAAAFCTFLGIVWWAYAPSRKSRFDRDARLPFDEDEQ